MGQPVYLDYNATTPTDPRVVEAMRQYELIDFGNASSQHLHGITAQLAVEEARRQVANLLCAEPEEDRLHKRSDREQQPGVAGSGEPWPAQLSRTHILASSIEHASVLGPLDVLGR